MTDQPEDTTPATTAADKPAEAEFRTGNSTADDTQKSHEFMPSSPHDKSFSKAERQAYERKVMNFGLVLLVVVLAGTGIAAHALFSNLAERADSEWSLDLDTGDILPETPFSPMPAPAPQPAPPKREPTSIQMPDTPMVPEDPAMRRVIGKVTGIVDGQPGMESSLYARIEYYMAEEHATCFFHAPVAFGTYRAGDTVTVEYNAEAPDICGTSQIVP